MISFDTANYRFSGRAEFFQLFFWRFKLAVTNRSSQFKISAENARSFKMDFEKYQLFICKTHAVLNIPVFFLQKLNEVIVYILV